MPRIVETDELEYVESSSSQSEDNNEAYFRKMDQGFSDNIDFSLSQIARHNTIIIADDNMVNVELIKAYAEELGVVEQCIFCIDGEHALTQAKLEIKKAYADESYSRNPIKMMLLDF